MATAVKSLFVILFLLCFSEATFADGVSAYDAWKGTYKYVGIGPKDTGGPTPFMEITLTIATPAICVVTEEGFQTDGKIACSLLVKEHGIDVHFENIIQSTVGIPNYQANQNLFSLYGSPNNGDIVTKWDVLRPEFAKSIKGNYFKKSKINESLKQ